MVYVKDKLINLLIMEGMNELRVLTSILLVREKGKIDLFLSRVTSYWSEWPPSKYLQIINTGEGVERKEPSCLLYLSAQSCLTVCNPMDYNLPGSSAHGVFQARVLGWVAISYSRQSS